MESGWVNSKVRRRHPSALEMNFEGKRLGLRRTSQAEPLYLTGLLSSAHGGNRRQIPTAALVVITPVPAFGHGGEGRVEWSGVEWGLTGRPRRAHPNQLARRRRCSVRRRRVTSVQRKIPNRKWPLSPAELVPRAGLVSHEPCYFKRCLSVCIYRENIDHSFCRKFNSMF